MPRRKPRRGVTLTDVVMSLLLVLLIGIACLATVAELDTRDTRIHCASNLRMIGQALLLYSNESKGAYPRTYYRPDDPPTWGTPYDGNDALGADEKADPFAEPDSAQAKLRPAPNDVTAALYLLLRTQDITSEAFVCPATLHERWDFGGGANTALSWNNWPGNAALRRHLSYSYQNPYGSTKSLGYKLNNSIPAEFVVAADMNPGGEELLKLTADTPPGEMSRANSFNHARRGQNVLFGDGHVEFAASPFAGIRRDNIYTFGRSGDRGEGGGDGIAGWPVDADDSILLPAAHDIGAVGDDGNLIDAARFKAFTGEEEAQLRRHFSGRYTSDDFGQLRKLEITESRIVMGSGARAQDLAYEIVGQVEDRIRVHVKPKQGPRMMIAYITPGETTLTIDGAYPLSGEWTPE